MLPPTKNIAANNAVAKLDSAVQTLPELLKAADYTNAAVVANPWASRKFGFDQGYDKFIFKHGARATEITVSAIGLIDRFLEEKKHFFLYLHYLDPHSPYSAPKKFNGKFSGVLEKRSYAANEMEKLNRYDDEIFYLDTVLGKLFRYLKEKQIYDDLIIVLVSDHGEQFMERGNQGHGFELYSEEIRVPLILKTGVKKQRGLVKHPVSVIDIAPTVLQLANLEVPQHMQGVSLLDGSMIKERQGVFSEVWRKFTQRAFVSRDLNKLIIKELPQTRKLAVVGLFDLTADPLEQRPVKDFKLASTLQDHLEQVYQSALAQQVSSVQSVSEIDPETLRQLRSLGYFQ